MARKCPSLGRRESLRKVCKRGSNMTRVILCKVSGAGERGGAVRE
jgi:hypothetical protein